MAKPPQESPPATAKTKTSKFADSVPPADTHQSQAKPAGLPFRIIGQYIQDLSFENPGALKLVTREFNGKPKLNLHWHINNQPLAHRDNIYSAETRITLSAHFDKDGESQACYMLEMGITAIVEFTKEPIDEEIRQQILRIEIPRLVYPFLRHQTDNLLRDGGYPGMQLPSLDFVAAYRQYRQQKEHTPPA